MIDVAQVGRRIARLRKERGMTGEALAEALSISSQAVSKWENGRSLPDTAILPSLSEALGCTIDAILQPRRLEVLYAVFTDGREEVDVAQALEARMTGDRLDVPADAAALGISFDSERPCALCAVLQTPSGPRAFLAPEGVILHATATGGGHALDVDFDVLGAWFGTRKAPMDKLERVHHYEYFRWDEIPVNVETFAGSTDVDDTEYLTVVYRNREGIHCASCAEGESLRYRNNRTELAGISGACRVVEGVPALGWGRGRDCTWAGALWASLQAMGVDITYERLMGMSGACYRFAHAGVWDFSAVDALVAFDYETPAYRALGFETQCDDRVEKPGRRAVRRRIVEDIDRGMPPIAIHLSRAPEWGVIAGYADGGRQLLCRTYFDDSDAPVVADLWPWAVAHFGARTAPLGDDEALRASLRILVASAEAPPHRGYVLGLAGLHAWAAALRDDAAFESMDADRRNRVYAVNDYMLLNLVDARRCAAVYLREGGEGALAGIYEGIHARLHAFLTRVREAGESNAYNGMTVRMAATKEMRWELAGLVDAVADDEREAARLAREKLG